MIYYLYNRINELDLDTGEDEICQLYLDLDNYILYMNDIFHTRMWNLGLNIIKEHLNLQLNNGENTRYIYEIHGIKYMMPKLTDELRTYLEKKYIN